MVENLIVHVKTTVLLFLLIEMDFHLLGSTNSQEKYSIPSRVDKDLRAMGWTPIHFWSKEVLKDADGCVSAILELIIDSYEE